MIMKFDEIGDLGVLPGRGRKPVGTETVEEVAIAAVESASSSIYSSASGQSVSRELEIPWSILPTFSPYHPEETSLSVCLYRTVEVYFE
ncbi:hypothetical protein TNCV_3036391 [Trichonephila clavipes]|nr:hypothetical protein TNCV_3036391 [Trichonephila clavipes]